MKNKLFTTMLIASSVFSEEVYKDYLIQEQKIEAPKRGTLKGEYSSIGEQALNLAGGSFSISLPISFPSKRGSMITPYSVSYSPGFGISSYGIGWNDNLYIERTREVGVVDFLEDSLISPWGLLVKGDDGNYYTKKVTDRIKVEVNDDEIIAYLPDGKKLIFGSDIDDLYNEKLENESYRWLLKEAQDLVGHKTVYTYERMTTNSKSRLKNISYGGLNDDFQYRVDFKYEELSNPLSNYASGNQLSLDSRISKIEVNTINSGSFEKIYWYELEFKDDFYSPSFYLESIQKYFSETVAEPKIQYSFDNPHEFLTSQDWAETSQFNDLAKKYHNNITNRSLVNYYDFNNDGRLDIEIGQNYERYIQTDDGYEKSLVEAASGDISPWCLFPVVHSRKSRKYSRFKGTNSEPYIFDLFEFGEGSVLEVCKQNGEREKSIVFPKFWKYGLKTILSDVNKDTKPDIVHLLADGYEVILNTSTENEVDFETQPSLKKSLNLPSIINGFWIRDINGDGHSDIVIKGSSSLYVYHGNIKGEFSKEYVNMRFFLSSGHSNSSNVKDREFQFIDFNKDSLADIMVQGDGVTSVYINNGRNYVQLYMPGLFVGQSLTNNLISGDLLGDGNNKLVTTLVDDTVLTLDLERTKLGLLNSIDDGQGNVITFNYGKSKAQIGFGQRKTIITSLVRNSYGEGQKTIAVDYTNAKLHSGTGNFLGFEMVSSQTDTLSKTVNTYTYDESDRRYVDNSKIYDLGDLTITKTTNNTYTTDTFAGIDYKFKNQIISGYKSLDGLNNSTLTTTIDLNRNTLCKEVEQKINIDQTKRVTNTITYSQNFPEYLSCFELERNINGNDFDYTVTSTRDSLARVTQVNIGTKLLQKISYASNGLINDIEVNGNGVTTYGYDDNYRLNSVTKPDGINTTINGFNLIFDSPTEIVENRNGDEYIQNFDYDDYGRLFKSWDNITGYTIDNPLELVTYTFGTSSTLSSTEVKKRNTIKPGNEQQIISYEWNTATGKSVAQGIDHVSGLITNNLKSYDVQNNIESSFIDKTLKSVSNPKVMALSSFSYGTELGKIEKDGFGIEKLSQNRTYKSLINEKTTTKNIEGEDLKLITTENSNTDLKTSKYLDAFGNEVKFINQDGHIYKYKRDSLGRLSKITLPSGDYQEMDYDTTLGKISKITSSIAGDIDYEYDQTTNLLKSKSFTSKTGQLERRIDYTYDFIGRKTLESYKKYSTGGTLVQTLDYEYFYDGNFLTLSEDSTQLGRLSAIRGPKYTKEFEYDADGKILYEKYIFDSKYQLEKTYTYLKDRKEASTTLLVKDLINNLTIVDRTFNYIYEKEKGLLKKVQLGTDDFINVSYSLILQPSRIDTFGTKTHLRRDTKTLKVVEIESPVAHRIWSFDERGHIDYVKNKVSGINVEKDFTYSNRGFLNSIDQTRDSIPDLTASYDYDEDGIINYFVKNGVDQNFVNSANSWEVNGTIYNLDSFGRVTQKGSKAFTYNAQSRIEDITDSSTLKATYYYDEERNPILKTYVNGEMDFFYGDSILSGETYYEPIKFNGVENHVVGYFENNTFRKVEVDHLNSLIGDSDGNINISTPYGERVTRATADHKILDYTLKGYDQDVEAVRMGRRFYDSKVKRFLSPDGYLFENVSELVKRPAEMNLFGYTGNDPIGSFDPNGDAGIKVGLGGSGDFLFGGKGEVGIVATASWKDGVQFGIYRSVDARAGARFGLSVSVNGSVNNANNLKEVNGTSGGVGVDFAAVGGIGLSVETTRTDSGKRIVEGAVEISVGPQGKAGGGIHMSNTETAGFTLFSGENLKSFSNFFTGNKEEVK